MALKVLLADDSVPAQNMGKKILTDAGYEVLTVSNGLEALRKIADMVPDIAILDIFMPGYSGLEICERLRANAATSELPVILTVGKLEPYRPEDGENVRSNAVIVKPFAAAELVSAVRSLTGAPTEELHRASVTEPLEPAPVADAPTTPEAFAMGQFAEELPAYEQDEPLFSRMDYAGGESAHSVEPFLSEEEPLGAKSLAFDPSAARTSFSASVVEPAPGELHLAAQAVPNAFTEFDMESALDSWQPSPEEAVDHDATAEGEMASSTPIAFAAEPSDATPVQESEPAAEVIWVDAAPSEPESPPVNDWTFEPTTDVPEGVQSGVAEAFPVEADRAPEAILAEGVDPLGESAWTETPTQSTPADPMPADPGLSEEAGGMAFEDLYNSAALTEPAMFTPPEPEILPAASDDTSITSAAIAPAAEPELAEECQPIGETEPISEGEPLLEDNGSAELAPVGSVQQPTEAFASDLECDLGSGLGYDDSPLPAAVSDFPPQFYAELPAEVPENPRATVAAVESDPLASEASPEHSHLVAEVAKVEALLVQMQAVRQASEPVPELEHADTEFHSAAAPMYPLQPAASAVETEPAQVRPVQAHEETQEEAVTVTGQAQMETGLHESGALVQQEPEAEPLRVGLPPELAEEEQPLSGSEVCVDETSSVSAQRLQDAERIHKAVEKVFDRFRPLLVAAIVREMARLD